MGKKGSMYGDSLFEEVERYARNSLNSLHGEKFDVIHCHDWLTYLAGIEAKKASGKPLVVHIHATEFDRTGGNGLNQVVYDIEKKGFDEASNGPFFREGKKNQWKRILNKDQIKKIENKFSKTMLAFGYELSKE